ncbi:MAG: MBL fold metallo-hydrolase [Saprospiraceae bacterium]|nr:MBL fold metallo-hydrolase [Saprospiraceae bacterium]
MKSRFWSRNGFSCLILTIKTFKVSDHISVFQSTLWQLNSVACHYAQTDVIWDPAYTPDELLSIQEAIPEVSHFGKFLIYTHGDYDHIVGRPYFEGFTQIGSDLMEVRQDKSRSLAQLRAIDDEYYIDRSVSLRYPELDMLIRPETQSEYRLGGIDIKFYAAQGHTADGLFSLLPELGLLVAGDYLSNVEFPFIEDTIGHYHESMDTAKKILKECKVETMVPGHGTIAYTTKEILNRIDHSTRYLDSLVVPDIVDWRISWGYSPFESFLDKMHQKNIDYVRSHKI